MKERDIRGIQPDKRQPGRIFPKRETTRKIDPRFPINIEMDRYPRLTQKQQSILFEELAKEKNLPEVSPEEDTQRKRKHVLALRDNASLQREITDAEREKFDYAIATCGSVKELVTNGSFSLVFFLAKFVSANKPTEDMVQAGMIGLQRAIDRYDKTKGNSFSAYARSYIIKEITDTKGERTDIKLPRDVRIAVNTIKHIRGKLICSLGREPTAEEVLGEVDPAAANYNTIMSNLTDTLAGLYVDSISYNTVIDGTNDLKTIDAISHAAPSPEKK